LSAVPKKRGPGRPPHADPPRLFSTNIPTSLYERVDRWSKATGQPKSVHLEAALRAYLGRHEEFVDRPSWDPARDPASGLECAVSGAAACGVTALDGRGPWSEARAAEPRP
jgi:hypothetical protein